MNNQYLHEVAITAIIVKGGKYLIVKRSKNKKRFPSMWTVPGGKLEISDYTSLPKDTKDYWYNVLEKTLAREVKEEAEDFAWVTPEEAKNYNLIDGILDELLMADKKLAGKKVTWSKTNAN